MRKRLLGKTREQVINKILNSKQYGKPSVKAIVLKFLMERKKSFDEEIDNDGVYYYLRQQTLVPEGYPIEGNEAGTRKMIKNYVLELCELLEVKRKDLGIVVQAHAQMYFRGKLYDIDLDGISGLADTGVIVLIVEKDMIATKLRPLSDEFGIAIISSHGFLTENAEDLSNMISIRSRNIALLADFDMSGVLIGLKIPNIHRIGIDFDTLRFFGHKINAKTLRKFEEGYTPVSGHLNAVEEYIAEGITDPVYAKLLTPENLEYLRSKRIEINSVLTAQGEKDLREYVSKRLKETFPILDYTRAINLYELSKIIPQSLIDLYEIVYRMRDNILSSSRIDYGLKLDGYDGSTKIFDGEENKEKPFLKVKDVEERIEEDFHEQLEDNEDLSPVLEKIEKLIDELKKKQK
jgi:hypothetical protein